MADTLTESFCERCGTRYTFEAPKERSAALSGVRVLGKGLRKFALTRAASLDEAISSAKADDERAAVARQLDAFHGAFHFCLSCRQYTCTDCWNEPAGVCLTCEPTPESQVSAALGAALSAEVAAHLLIGEHVSPVQEGPRPDWPFEDRWGGEPSQSLDPLSMQPPDGRRGEVAIAASAAESPIEADSAVEDDLAVNPLLRAFQPGTSLDDAIAAYEAAVTSARQPEPVVAVAPEPEPELLRPAAIAEAVDAPSTLPLGPAGEDPRFAAWQIIAPEIAAAAPPTLPPFSSEGFAARIGRTTQSAPPASGAPAQAAATRAQPETGARTCVSCGLTLSANARFCRRCGTRQG